MLYSLLRLLDLCGCIFPQAVVSPPMASFSLCWDHWSLDANVQPFSVFLCLVRDRNVVLMSHGVVKRWWKAWKTLDFIACYWAKPYQGLQSKTCLVLYNVTMLFPHQNPGEQSCIFLFIFIKHSCTTKGNAGRELVAESGSVARYY